MLVTAAVKTQVKAIIEQCYVKAEAHYSRTFSRPTIQFKKRGTTAGTANGSLNILNYNAVLLMENQDDFCARTVPHEVAHLIDYAVNPHNHEGGYTYTRSGRLTRKKRNVHGREFRFIMETVLGADDSTRCHEYDTTNARVKKRGQAKYVWKSVCGKEMKLGIVRHNRMQGGVRYWPRGLSHLTFTFSHIEGQSPMPVAAQAARSAPKPKPAPRVKPASGRSNKSIARGVYANAKDRNTFVMTCVEKGINSNTAGTYFHNFNSGKWT